MGRKLDRQTDGQTDGIAVANTALAMRAELPASMTFCSLYNSNCLIASLHSKNLSIFCSQNLIFRKTLQMTPQALLPSCMTNEIFAKN